MDDQKLVGLPENPPAVPVELILQVSGQELRYTVDTKYRTVDTVPVKCHGHWSLRRQFS